MSPTRRQLARVMVLTPAALLLVAALPAMAQDAFGPEGPANVFISPCGKPFRAKAGEPYPVVEWFRQADANGDGKIDHAEFLADSLAFFKHLDRNNDQVISPQEVAYYEQRIAPEVLGMRVEIDSRGVAIPRARIWKTQGIPGGTSPGMGSGYSPGGGGVDPGAGGDEGGETEHRARPYDASGKGAAPYSFFDEPEPVTAADLNFRGLISKGDFLKLADAHFQTLDSNGAGFLTLETLPKTPAQRRLERLRHRRR